MDMEGPNHKFVDSVGAIYQTKVSLIYTSSNTEGSSPLVIFTLWNYKYLSLFLQVTSLIESYESYFDDLPQAKCVIENLSSESAITIYTQVCLSFSIW